MSSGLKGFGSIHSRQATSTPRKCGSIQKSVVGGAIIRPFGVCKLDRSQTTARSEKG